MALSKAKKQEIVQELSELLDKSKMTVVAKYRGTGVKQMQDLRRSTKENGTKIKVVKNRLVIQAINANDKFSEIDTTVLVDQLLYAFNGEDEVAPAQGLAQFAKKNPTIEFVGALTSDGKFMSADEVKDLAKLPSKPQLIAGVVSTLSSPLNGITSGLSGNLPAILKGLEAKAK